MANRETVTSEQITSATRRDLLRAAAAGAMIGTIGAACGPFRSAGAPPEGAAGPGGALTTPATVVWLNWESGPTQLEGNTKSVESFQAMYPRITVENMAQGGGGYWDKLASLQAAGTPPDLWEWEPKHVVDYVLRRRTLDLQPLVARDRFDLSDFFPKGIEQYRWRNGLWGLPRDFPNRNVLYSVTAFQKDGVPRPSSDWKKPDWTWDVFLDAARRLTKPDGAQFGFNTGRSFRQWAPWVWGNGGEVIDESKLECVLDAPPAVEALQFLQDLIHRYRVWPESLPAGANFQGGQVAMQEGIPAQLGNLRRDIGDKFVWDVVMHPRGKNGKYVAAGGGAGWTIDRETKARDATWAFLKHVTSSEQQIQLCQLGGTIGSRRSVMTNPCFLQRPPEHIQLFIEGTDYLHVDVRVAGWTEVEKVFDEELRALWSGQKPARQVAADIKSKVDPILKQAAREAGA
jgi:multiple sugar transport system substrate-binding protein